MSNIDMLPESYREEKQKYRVDMVCVIFFAVMMVILVVVEFITGRDFDSIRQRHQINTAKFEQRDQEIKQYTDDKIKRGSATTQLQTMLDLTARFPCSRIFAEIANKAKGTNVCLQRMDIRRTLITPAEEQALAKAKEAKKSKKVVSSKSPSGAKPKPKGLGRVFVIEINGLAAKDRDIENLIAWLSEGSDVFKNALVHTPWQRVRKATKNDIECKAFPMTIVLDKRLKPQKTLPAKKPAPAKPVPGKGVSQ
jgi:hypothetical protein